MVNYLYCVLKKAKVIKMKASNEIFCLFLMTYIKISKQKDFLSGLRTQLNVPESAKSIEPKLLDKLNYKTNTLALNSLLRKSQIKVCCPRSLIAWQQKHKMKTSQSFSNCSINVPEPEPK